MSTHKMLVVGLTGRSGSGKSTVSGHYASLGYTIANGDKISRQVTASGSACLEELVQAFGGEILANDHSLLRQNLANIAFESKESTAKLVKITHKYIKQELVRQIMLAQNLGEKLFFVDGAVIVGAPAHALCNKLVVVTAPLRLSISRIILRDGISKTAACQRLNAQMPEEKLCKYADFMIDNSGGINSLIIRANDVLSEILKTI